MRTFIAIELTEDVRTALEGLSQRLRRHGAQASWVRPERIHVTLRFLGEIEPEAAEQLGELLVQRYTALTPFHMAVRGTGAFPNLRNPSVVWVGVEPLEGGLQDAAAIAESCAQAIGVPPEKRPFRPHLTIARIRDPRTAGELGRALPHEREFQGGEFDVRHVSLFSSELTRQGPIYTRLRVCPFSSI